MNEGTQGRTALVIWALELVGLKDIEHYGSAKEYTTKNIDKLDHGQHGPAYPLFWGGLSCYYMEDKSIWEKYWTNYRTVFAEAQKEDGSILIKARKGAFFPVDGVSSLKFGIPTYTTAHYVIIMQIHKGHLLFDKIKKA
jgi:hypothetical protein